MVKKKSAQQSRFSAAAKKCKGKKNYRACMKKELKKPAVKHIHKKAVKKVVSKSKAKKVIPKEEIQKVVGKKKKKGKYVVIKNRSSLHLLKEDEIAMDFATKAYKKFDKIIKSIILFGSSVKDNSTPNSDIDIIIIVDDVTIRLEQEVIFWYRDELAKLMKANPYKKELHINTIKLSTWWSDLKRGDPVVINVLRYGEALIDFGGFFNPLKVLLQEGKIRSTPEAIYTALQRAPQHLSRSKAAQLGAVEGIYWAMVDASHAALMAAKISPPSPEHIPVLLKETFVDKNLIKMKYVGWFRDIYTFHKRISHGDISSVRGIEIDEWQRRADEFINLMGKLIEQIVKV